MTERTFGFGIVGCGVIAPFHARAIGDVPNARLVAVADVIPERAATRGAEFGVEYGSDIDALLADITGGRGADVVVEVSGRPPVMARALELVAFKGRVAYVGINVGGEAPAKLGLIQSKELRITGTIGSPGVWPQTLRFLAGSKLDLTPLVTQHFTIDEALDALDAAHHPATTIKAHIELTGTL